jgi:hypothetical protein
MASKDAERAPHRRKLPYYALIIPVYLIGKLWHLVTGRPERIQAMRNALLDPSLLRQQSPRTYVYSREDQIIAFADVEAHVAEARRLGPVEALEFRRCVANRASMTRQLIEPHRTTHVGHMRGDPERYWRAVRETYEKA